MGKQGRAPKGGTTSTQTDPGALGKGKLELDPGDLVLSDQCVSLLLGKRHSSRGQRNDRCDFQGGALFWGMASCLKNQAGFAAHETIAAKFEFGREALSCGAVTKKHAADNGVCASK